MNKHEWLCACQSKNGRTGMCDVIPKYQDELALYNKALELVCEHIAEANPLLFSLVGKGLIPVVKEHFLRQANMLLKVKNLTEAQKNDT